MMRKQFVITGDPETDPIYTSKDDSIMGTEAQPIVKIIQDNGCQNIIVMSMEQAKDLQQALGLLLEEK